MRNIFIRFNLMVILTLIIIKFAVNPVLEQYGLKVVNKEVTQYYEELLKGPYFLIMKHLDGVPENQIPDKIQALQKEFGFPVNAVSLDSKELDEVDKSAFKQRQIVIRSAWQLYYKRVGSTNWAIKLGPLKDMDETNSFLWFDIVVWASLLCLVSLISLVSAYPFWKNLKALVLAAKHFGEGDFSARADVSNRSPLKPVADTFNHMASKIGGLIQSQKLLINAVSHELRTPLSRMRFGMEMLETAKGQTRIQKYTTGIMDDLDDLDCLVSELLTYAAFDRESKFINSQEIKTVSWFNDLAEKLEPLAGDKRIQLDLSGAPSSFRADAKLFSRALENLVLNGLCYTQSKVLIRAEKYFDQLQISVIDDGPGIPEDDMERIFKPFVRLDESRNRDSGGVGLGLAIVKQIITGHRGKVWVEKKDSPGACIYIRIPLHTCRR